MIRTRRLLPPTAPKPAREHIVPMINVVFLLLIFFLLAARIAPPDPVEVALPVADGPEDQGAQALYLAKDGTLAYGALRGQPALAAAVANGAVALRADAGAQAATLARTINDLTAQGATRISVVTGAP